MTATFYPFQGSEQRDIGIPALPHYIQCSIQCGTLSLGLRFSVGGGGGAGLRVFRRDIQRTEAYFYANYGLLSSTLAARFQREFNVLVDILKGLACPKM